MPRVILGCTSTSAGFAMPRSPICLRRRGQIYRNRIDGLAERWFRQGASQRDLGLLRRVVDQAFCSSWGDDALELLGDLAFQDGRFGEALAMYRRLVRGPSRRLRSCWFIPIPRSTWRGLPPRNCSAARPPARSRPARRSSTSSRGSTPRRRAPWPAARVRMRRFSPNRLAADHLAPPSQPDSRWPTFAGSLTRSKVVAGPIDVGSTQWRVELEKVRDESSAGVHAPRRRWPWGGRQFARAALGLPSDRAGGPGDRRRWHAGAGV